jgi:hypothetical protein
LPSYSALPPGLASLTTTSRVAGGVFAPGHLGELTQIVPFEMVDAALEATGAVQARVRDLPSRVVVYLLLAGCLFSGMGYLQVWQRLVAGLDGLPVAAPTASALAQARRRVGVGPLRFLFELLRGPAPGGLRWRGLLVCALDGTTMAVPDSAANLACYPRPRGGNGTVGYPLARLVALVACGTRAVIDAVSGPAAGPGTGEVSYAYRLLAALRPGMLLLADRNFAAGKLAAAVTGTGAQFLIRCKAAASTGPKLPVLSRCPDGSYLSLLGGVQVRVIDAEITLATTTGRRTGVYRLATSLLDHRRHPAFDLVKLYHSRWEIETCYLELKATILGGRVLRARTPAGLEQEICALLVTYQILRLAMADATATRPGTDPDRASFTIALHAARDQLIQAAGVIADTVIDLAGTIGRQVLANLLPDRRPRVSRRAVKRAISKYNPKGPAIDRTSYKATLHIAVLLPPDSSTTSPDP